MLLMMLSPRLYPAAIEAPVFATPLKAGTVESGQPLELAAAINSFAEPVEAAWQKDNKPIDMNTKCITAACENGKCSLKIDSCSLADAGEYSVTLKNPSGSVTSSAKITIKG